MTTRDMQFEDLPLFVTGGYEAGQVNGTAAISYHREGDWNIDGIWLDGFRRATPEERATGKPSWITKSIEIDAGTPLYMMIYDSLESERRHEITDFVWQCIDEDKSIGRDSRAALRLVPA
jgi:hypothetical protein